MNLLLLLAFSAFAADTPFYLREMSGERDVAAVNENFRSLSNDLRVIESSVTAIAASIPSGAVSLTSTNTWSGGNTWTTNASTFSAQMAYQSISARAYNSGSIAFADDTWTIATLDTESFDTNALHSTSANTGRMTAGRAGIYSIIGNARFDNGNANGVIGLRLLLNGATPIAINYFESSGGQGSVDPALVVATLYKLALNDYVEMQGFIDDGNGGSMVTDGVQGIHLSIAWVGDN